LGGKTAVWAKVAPMPLPGYVTDQAISKNEKDGEKTFIEQETHQTHQEMR